jgi:hypothetical protein
MSKYLKGNYELPNNKYETKVPQPAEDPERKVQAEFERRALERLGGSIAFVMRSSSFIVDPGAPAADNKANEGTGKDGENV